MFSLWDLIFRILPEGSVGAVVGEAAGVLGVESARSLEPLVLISLNP
jgi:hypothetical protein